MADPISIGAMIIGGIGSAVGGIMEGNAKANAANYNAQVAEQNAGIARAQGAEDARRMRVMGRKTLGDIRAGYGSSGVSLEGSALDVLEDSAANSELDALTSQHQGELKARAYEGEARMERFKARTSKTGGMLGAASGLLSLGGKLLGGKD